MQYSSKCSKVQKFSEVFFMHEMYGPVAQLVSVPPCHGGGRGFKSRQGRKVEKPFRKEGFFD